METLEEVQAQLAEANKKVAELSTKLSSFDGIDLSAIKAMKDTLEAQKLELQKVKDGASGVPPEKMKEIRAEIRKEVSDEFAGKLSDAMKQNEALSASLHQVRVVDAGVQTAEKTGKLNKTGMKYFREELAKSCGWEQDRVVVLETTPEGKKVPRRSLKDPKISMSVEEFLENFAQENPELANATGTGGGHESGKQRTGEQGKAGQHANLSVAEVRGLPQDTNIATEDAKAILDRAYPIG